MFPPAPDFTEKECPDLLGKVISPPFLTFPSSTNIDFECQVFIVTGGYSGVGFELVKIL
jgi:hypothetical protein